MTIDPKKWVDSLPNSNIKYFDENGKLNSDKWINTLATLPKKNNSTKKYSLVITLFVIGVIIVSVIKNETRYLQKEIHTLKVLINDIKLDLHQSVLDHEVITSPANVSRLAKEYLDSDFSPFKRSQIRQLNEESVILTKLGKKKNFDEINGLKKKIKYQVAKKIKEKKLELKKLEEIYSNPKNLPDEVKSQVAKKIDKTKNSLKKLYSSPEEVLTSDRIQRWAVVQVVKVFLGIPVIPGK